MPNGRLWRVTFDEGFGYPECRRRERTSRKYDDPRSAARMVRTVLDLPSHHRLVSVETTATDWQPIDPDTLLEFLTNPEPEGADHAEPTSNSTD